MESGFDKDKILIPRQPLMVMAADYYYKVEIKEFGISHFYSFKVSPTMLQKVQLVPDCCVDIAFDCSSIQPEAYCYGSLLKPRDFNHAEIFKEGKRIFGVRFLPGKGILPGGMSTSVILDKSIKLSEIISDKTLINKIAYCTDFIKQIEMFMEWYVPAYKKAIINNKHKEITDYVVDKIVKNRGHIKVESISDEIGYSTRYINKIFREAYGMSPKTFLKIIRFQGVLSEFRNNIKIIDVATDLGFTDQSHLGREFKEFTGMTPKKYWDLLNNDEFKNRLIILKNSI